MAVKVELNEDWFPRPWAKEYPQQTNDLENAIRKLEGYNESVKNPISDWCNDWLREQENKNVKNTEEKED